LTARLALFGSTGALGTTGGAGASLDELAAGAATTGTAPALVATGAGAAGVADGVGIVLRAFRGSGKAGDAGLKLSGGRPSLSGISTENGVPSKFITATGGMRSDVDASQKQRKQSTWRW
jgi:hypothetical protein